MHQQRSEESSSGAGSKNSTNLKELEKQVALCSLDPNNKWRVPAYYSRDRFNIYDATVTFPLVPVGQFHSGLCTY